MKALVTGVAGFIGSTLAERLIANGNDVIGVDCFTPYYDRSLKIRNLSNLLRSKHFLFHDSDLSLCAIDPILDGVEVVFHESGQPGVRSSWGDDFQEYLRHNVAVTQRLLESCRKREGTAVVVASSSSVYGTANRYPVVETDPTNPISPYGVTKLAAEHLCTLYGKEFGLLTASLRYFTVFGPRQRPDMAMTRLIKAAILGEEFPMYGSGEQRRDFTFVEDVVEANLRLADYLRTSRHGGQVFNVGNNNPVSLNEVVSTIEELVGRRVKLRRLPRQEGDPMETGADSNLLRRTVGWRSLTATREGLNSQVSWLKGLLTQD